MVEQALRSELRDIIDRRGQRDRLGDHRRARLETLRRRGIGRARETDLFDHRTAALPRGHRLEQALAGPEDADAGGAVELVPRKHVEITIERGHVERHARRGLAAVEQQLRAHAMRQIGGAAGVEHRAQHVGEMRQRNQFVARRQHRLERVAIDPSVLGQRADVDDGTGAFGDHLPGHDVGMMLQLREHDPVAFAQVRHAPALRHQIDALGRAAHEDDLVLACGAHELGDLAPRCLVAQRHLRAAAIHAAMDGGVVPAQRIVHGVEHGLRFLRGGGGVEIVPGLAVGSDHAGEIGLQAQSGTGDMEWRSLAHRCLSSLSSATRISRSRASSSSASPTSASPTKAWTSSRRDSSGGRPRAAM